MKESQVKNRIMQILSIINNRGHTVPNNVTILDFGCGAGHKLQVLLDAGYEAYGCDVSKRDDLSKDLAETNRLINEGYIQLIDPDNYRIPFDDSMFDIVISDQVFEHVQDYKTAIREIKRVTKNDGQGLHMFPSRFRLIPPLEPHIQVPLGTMVQSYWWVALWAFLGVRTPRQKGWKWKTVANKNYQFLKNNTNYLTKRQIRTYFINAFENVEFCGDSFAKVSKNKYIKMIMNLPYAATIFGVIYGTFKARIIYTSSARKK